MCHCNGILSLLASALSGVKVETLHVGAEKGTTAVSSHLVLNVLGYLSSRRRNTSPGLLANAVVKYAQLRGVFRHASLPKLLGYAFHFQLCIATPYHNFAGVHCVTKPDRFKHIGLASLPGAIACHILASWGMSNTLLQLSAGDGSRCGTTHRWINRTAPALSKVGIGISVLESCSGTGRRANASGGYDSCAESYILVRYMAHVSSNFVYINLDRWKI